MNIYSNHDGLFLSLKLKKSGKEPKVGAEVTLGEMSRKTTVSPQTSFSLEEMMMPQSNTD